MTSTFFLDYGSAARDDMVPLTTQWTRGFGWIRLHTFEHIFI